MANIKSSAKRDVKSKELRAKNRADKTELKTMMKKFDAAVAEGNRETAVSAYKVAVKTVDRAQPIRSLRWLQSSTRWRKFASSATIKGRSFLRPFVVVRAVKDFIHSLSIENGPEEV